MANNSSEFVSFLADDDAAVHAMMNGADNNLTSTALMSDDAAAEGGGDDDDDDSCGVYNWPLLFLFTIVIAAIGTILLRFINRYNKLSA